jgi:DNA-binding CsgD family transcriptional regulator
LIARLFGLTSAEARLAALLADGMSLAEAAAALAISEGSARTYSKRIFAKTGVSRQAELVRLVLKSVAALAVPRSDE